MIGSPEVVGVGYAMKFYASQRIDVRRSKQVKDKESGEAEGNITRAKVVKNKIAPPFRVAEYVIKFGVGIDKDQEVFDLSVAMNIIEKAGSWFSYQGTKLGQGGAKVLEILKDNPELMEELRTQVVEGLKQQ